MITTVILIMLCCLAGYFDLKKLIIPDWITLPGIVLGIGLSFIPGGISWQEALTGGLAGLGFFGLTAYIASRIMKKEALGGGDIKLASMLGTFLGLGDLAYTVFVASFAGMIVTLILVLVKKRSARSPIPFGFYLAASAAAIHLL